MPIPSDIQNLVNAANSLNTLESALASARDEKSQAQSRVAELNTKITDLVSQVQSARAALKTAAQAI